MLPAAAADQSRYPVAVAVLFAGHPFPGTTALVQLQVPAHGGDGG